MSAALARLDSVRIWIWTSVDPFMREREMPLSAWREIMEKSGRYDNSTKIVVERNSITILKIDIS